MPVLPTTMLLEFVQVEPVPDTVTVPVEVALSPMRPLTSLTSAAA